MFQEDIKLDFIKDKSEQTKKQYILFFNKIETHEEIINTGIHELRLNEIESLLGFIIPKNSKQAKVYCSMINGLRRHVYKNNENIFKNVDSDFYSRFD